MGKPNDFADRVRRFVRDGSPTPTKLKENLDQGTADRYQDFQVLLAKRKGLRQELLDMSDAKLVASFKKLMGQAVADNMPEANVRAQLRRHIRHALEALPEQAQLFDHVATNETFDPWPDKIFGNGKMKASAIRAAVARVIDPRSGEEHRARSNKRGIFEVIWGRYFAGAIRGPHRQTGKPPPAFQTPALMAGRVADLGEVVRRNRDAKKYLAEIKQRVSPDHWRVFMHLLQGYSDKEAPQVLGMSRATFFRRQKELVPHLKGFSLSTWAAVLQQMPGYTAIVRLAAYRDHR